MHLLCQLAASPARPPPALPTRLPANSPPSPQRVPWPARQGACQHHLGHALADHRGAVDAAGGLGRPTEPALPAAVRSVPGGPGSGWRMLGGGAHVAPWGAPVGAYCCDRRWALLSQPAQCVAARCQMPGVAMLARWQLQEVQQDVASLCSFSPCQACRTPLRGISRGR